MAFEWNFRELMRPRLADAYARRTYETLPEQPVNPMPTQMDPQGQGWLAAQQARNAQNMQGYIPNEAKQGYGQDYEDRAQSIAGEVGQDYYGNAGGDRGAIAAQVTPNQIKDLQSQIEVIEKRLTENKAKLKNWTGNADKIAAIEARKINVNDPTSIWRWKEDNDNARRIANEQNKTSNSAKANALIEANNILDSMIINDSLDTPTKNAMLSKLADVKTSLEKNGFDSSRAQKMIEQLKGNGPQTPREQAKTTWHGLQGKKDLTSAELDAAINDPNIKWDPNELEDAKNLSAKLKKHEAAAQDVKDMKADYKKRTGKDFDKADPYIQKKEQERWKRRNKK